MDALPHILFAPGCAAALLLIAALVPRANAATVVTYFNFEDGGAGLIDFVADVIPPGGDNPGGGFEASMLVLNGGDARNAAGLLQNRTANDSDISDPGLGLNLIRSQQNDGATLSFGAFTTNLIGLSLSLAIDAEGNSYNNVSLSYITTGAPVFVGIRTIIQGQTMTYTFALPVGAENQPAITFVLTFTNGQSNGQNRQTVIDNIQLTVDTIVPEPATVAGGLLGVLGLCWFQRRRLIGSVRLRRRHV